MMSTATALTIAYAKRGSGPQISHAANVSIAMTTTAGTKNSDTRSARRCSGAFERCALATRSTICASTVSRPTRSARIFRLPVPLSVPPVTRSSLCFSIGIGSPVNRDSSTLLAPSTTTPSTGTFSPGRMRNRSPTCTWSSGTSSSLPSARMRRAVFGARSSRRRIAADVLPRARSSSHSPNSTNATMTPAASKYTPTMPCASRIAGGNHDGANVAARLKAKATSTPRPISVYMLGEPTVTPFQPRT